MKRHRLIGYMSTFAFVAAGCSAIVSYDGYGDGVHTTDAAIGDGNGGGPPGGDGSSDVTAGDSDLGDVGSDSGDGAPPKKYALVALGGSRHVDGSVVRQTIVEIAPIHDDGTLGTFAVTTPLLAIEDNIGAAAVGSTVVVNDNAQAAAAVVQPDGGLSPWATIANTGHDNPTLAAIGSNVYLAAGTVSDVEIATTWRSTVTAPGVVTSWFSQTALPADGGPREDTVMVAHGSSLFLVGGNINGPELGNYLTANVDNAGAIGAWSFGALPATGDHIRAVVVRDYLILLGGSYPGIADQTVYSAHIDPSGALGAWNQGTDGPTLDGPGFCAHGDYAYLVGGYGALQTDVATVAYANVGANGFPGVWQATSPLSLPRFYMTCVIVEVP